MATLSVRNIVSHCLGKSGNLSILRDVLGVYGTDNPQNRPVLDRLNLIENNPFVRVALVMIQGASPSIQRDLDNANTVYRNECGAWVYAQASLLSTTRIRLRLTRTTAPGRAIA